MKKEKQDKGDFRLDKLIRRKMQQFIPQTETNNWKRMHNSPMRRKVKNEKSKEGTIKRWIK